VLATLTAETETGLVEQARQGDRSAFGELVRHHHAGMVNVVYRMCGDAGLAEDAAQEAFLRAWLHLSTFRPGSSLRNWLYRIAVNEALDVLRRERRAPQGLETVPAADPEPGPERALLRRERAGRVQQAILSLTDANRAVLVLREYGGLSYQEISTALDIPIGTVMSRLNYARNRLRELLADLESDHD
jgi:RNA polymerase sigma-70 factor (ECF subfamily)